MNIAEILRKMADIVDQTQDPGRPDEKIQNPAQLSPTAAGTPVENPDNMDMGADDAVMIPPLQLKTELLKKAVGVDSVFDPGEPRADEAHDNQHDELEIIRRHAGVPVAAIQELSNDEILDD
jgi:hypothetical protein